MTKHTRALKNAERDLAKRTAELDKLRAKREATLKATGGVDESKPSADTGDNTMPDQEDLEDLEAAILSAESRVKKASSKVAEAEMFVMRNRY